MQVPTGILRLILQDDGQVDIPYAPAENTAGSPKPCGTAAIRLDKGCPEAFTDRDGERHGRGPGDPPAAESAPRKAKGRKRNRLRAVAGKHRRAGRIRKADPIRRHIAPCCTEGSVSREPDRLRWVMSVATRLQQCRPESRLGCHFYGSDTF